MMRRGSWMVGKPVNKVLFIGMSLAISINLSCGASPSGGIDPPAFSPNSSIFFGALDVGLATTTADAEIRYTTDGSEPSDTHGATYGGPVRIDKTTMVKAAAFRSDGATSDVSFATYTKTGHTLGVGGLSATNVWIVGGYYDYMTLEPSASQYDGTMWLSTTLPTDSNILMAVWASASNDIFAVGLQGTIVHYDGASWASMTSGTTEDLYAVWAAAGNSVFAAGDNGTILHYDGSSWSVMTTPATNDLKGLFGISSSAVLAVGTGGTIFGYDGVTWGVVPSGVTVDLRGAWGTSSSNIYVVGDSGTIIWWNGVVFGAPMASGTTNAFRSVWGASGSAIFAVGDEGTIRFYNGASWTTMTSGTTNPLQSVWGTASDNVFTVGMCGTVLHFDGTTWSQPWGGGGKCVG
jgi:hypothetical protein